MWRPTLGRLVSLCISSTWPLWLCPLRWVHLPSGKQGLPDACAAVLIQDQGLQTQWGTVEV